MRTVRAVVMKSSLLCCDDFCLRSFARYLLRILGFIFWGTAAALAFGGVSVILMHQNYRYLFQESYVSLPGWLAVVAALILLPTGFIAVSISARECHSRQGALVYLLLLLFCLEVSSAVLAQFYSIRMASELKSSMGHLFYQYNGTDSCDPCSRAVDVMQRKLQCCGVQNYTDWLKATATFWHLPDEKAHVPKSCCKEKYSDCRGDLDHLEQLFQEGCLKKLDDWLCFVMLYLFWCCVALSVLELLAGVGNVFLIVYEPFHDLRILDSSTFM